MAEQNDVGDAAPTQDEADQADNGHFLKEPEASENQPSSSDQTLSWTGPEFVAHEKSPMWYLVVVVAAVILAGLIYLLSRDLITAIVVLVAAATLAGYGARRPKEVQYQLDSSGITIGRKNYSYGDFRSFSLSHEASFSSFNFMPLKRFAPPASIYCEAKQEDEVTSLLAERLPFEPERSDLIDNFMKYIRF